MNFRKRGRFSALAERAIVAVGTRSDRTAADRRRSLRISPCAWLLDDPARASHPGAGCAPPPAADIAGINLARAKMDPMEASARVYEGGGTSALSPTGDLRLADFAG